MSKGDFIFRKDILRHLEEILFDFLDDFNISKKDIKRFGEIANEYDQNYINNLIGKNVLNTLKLDVSDVYKQHVIKNELNMLKRVEYKLKKYGKNKIK